MIGVDWERKGYHGKKKKTVITEKELLSLVQ